MMIRKTLGVLLCVLIVLTAISAVGAQDENTIITGLDHPRGLAYDSAGNLYIAEAGSGGEFEAGVTQFGDPAFLGPTSQITRLNADGTQEVILPYLGSYSGEGLGVIRVLPTEKSLWLLFSEGNINLPLAWTALELDIFTMRIKNVIDFYTFEQENNTDGTEEIYNNPHDIDIAPDGTLFFVEAGGNAILTWTEADGLSVFKTWDDDPVPTSLSFAADGTIWLSFLGKEIAPGAGSVQHLSAEGEVLETFDGLTGVTDVLVTADGTVYFVEIFQPGENPEIPGAGRVSALIDGAPSVLLDGLSFPFGLAQAPDGSIVVSTDTVAFGEEYVPGSGSVVRVVPAN